MADEEIKLLHFIQEQARRDAEIAMARRKCIELEENIRDYHDRCVSGRGWDACDHERCGYWVCCREEKLIEQSTVLKEEIRRLERSRYVSTCGDQWLSLMFSKS